MPFDYAEERIKLQPQPALAPAAYGVPAAGAEETGAVNLEVYSSLTPSISNAIPTSVMSAKTDRKAAFRRLCGKPGRSVDHQQLNTPSADVSANARDRKKLCQINNQQQQCDTVRFRKCKKLNHKSFK